MNNEMSAELRNHIAETYTGDCWEPASSKLWSDNGTAIQIFVFEHDVEFQKQNWRCLIVSRAIYSGDSPADIDYSEDIYSTAWVL